MASFEIRSDSKVCFKFHSCRTELQLVIKYHKSHRYKGRRAQIFPSSCKVMTCTENQDTILIIQLLTCHFISLNDSLCTHEILTGHHNALTRLLDKWRFSSYQGSLLSHVPYVKLIAENGRSKVKRTLTKYKEPSKL